MLVKYMKELERELINFARWVILKHRNIVEEYDRLNIDGYEDADCRRMMDFVKKHYKDY